MHRSAPRLARTLAAASAVPVILFAAGCGLLGDKGGDSGGAGKSPDKAKSTPTVKAAKYAQLPDACRSVPKKTVQDIVPKSKDTSGTAVKSSDTSVRSGCSWNGLDGYQFRYLDLSYQRFESDPTLGTGEKQAAQAYTKQLKAATATTGAKGMTPAKLGGIGEQADSFTFSVTKDKNDYRNQILLARKANVIVIVNYNGAGFEGSKQPKAATMLKDGKKALEAGVAALR